MFPRAAPIQFNLMLISILDVYGIKYTPVELKAVRRRDLVSQRRGHGHNNYYGVIKQLCHKKRRRECEEVVDVEETKNWRRPTSRRRRGGGRG